jgi:hypothetical protein
MEQVSYFEKAGDRTEEVLEICKKYCEAHGIHDIVVASTTGRTGAMSVKLLKGMNIVVVTHYAGLKEAGKVELLEDAKKEIEKNGGKIIIATHALGGVESALRKFNTVGPVELIASALKIFGQGTKVCVEIGLMAADAGLIPVDRDVVCIAGTGHGADTAIVMKPTNTGSFFDLKIRKFLCKPANF